MTLKFAVAGGGFYGSHIATSLISLGFEVKVFEQHGRLLHEASGNNQFRLHQGFHYARHARTRVQSRDGFARFIERYGHLSSEVKDNFYAVPKYDSAIDFQTYKSIMTSSGVDFIEISREKSNLENVEGVINTYERVLMLENARVHFEKKLEGSIYFSTKVEKILELDDCIKINGEKFDYLIDATWGHLTPQKISIFFEPTILLYFEGPKDFPAITLVDGQLGSIYPTEESGVYTLSSVPHTPLGKCESSTEARDMIKSINSSDVIIKHKLMVEQISKYVPSFSDNFKFLGPQLSIKTKPYGANDDRSCYVDKAGRIFSVLSGKIDTIFFAMERILLLLEIENYKVSVKEESKLRYDIKLFNTHTLKSESSK